MKNNWDITVNLGNGIYAKCVCSYSFNKGKIRILDESTQNEADELDLIELGLCTVDFKRIEFIGVKPEQLTQHNLKQIGELIEYTKKEKEKEGFTLLNYYE